MLMSVPFHGLLDVQRHLQMYCGFSPNPKPQADVQIIAVLPDTKNQ
jgi:hypothetical protein